MATSFGISFSLDLTHFCCTPLDSVSRLREITSTLKKQSAMLEELRDIFLDKKRRPKREEVMNGDESTEFYV